MSPRRATYLVALILAAALAHDLMRMPIQVSDSLSLILDAQASPSVAATFAQEIAGRRYMRPLFEAEGKFLFDLADGNYWLVFRGFHALLLTTAILLFVRALRIRSWVHAAAAVFALTVLTGMNTFRGTVREAFIINHFLQIVVFCLIALNLARSQGGRWVDVAAVLTFVAASLTIETGLLVWVVLAAAWLCGMRGVSSRAVIVTTVLLGVYFWIRFFYLDVELERRGTGYLTRMLQPGDINNVFPNIAWLYLYNVATSLLSVLFSEPDGGIFEIARARLQGDVPPRLYVGLVSSALATAMIGWMAVSRLRRWRAGAAPDDGDRLVMIFGAVLVANATMSYSYTKHEIISAAGVFYAICAYVAACWVLERTGEWPRGAAQTAVVVALGVTASIWAFRSVGVHHMLRQEAFKQRNDWVYVETPRGGSPDDLRAAALIGQLRRDAAAMPVTNPYLLPRWTDRWWGE